MAAPPLPRLLLLAVGAAAAAAAGDGCTAGCDIALGSYTYLAGLIPFLLSRGQTYSSIANNYYNLTTADWLQKTNTYPPNNTPDTGTVNVTVNCSCGDASASPDYGLFLTYPLRDGETLTSAAVNNGFSSPSQMDLLRKYNPGMDSVVGRGIVYIPVKASTLSMDEVTPSTTQAPDGASPVAGITVDKLVEFSYQ